jgi:PadR family transcriptional regulator PadR
MPYLCVMNTENAKAQMRKGVLEMCILSILSDEEMYTSDIIESLKSAELIVVEGTLYPMLNRLKNAGLLDYVWKESQTGPPRKYYKITIAGSNTLEELMSSWTELVNSVALINAKNNMTHE